MFFYNEGGSEVSQQQGPAIVTEGLQLHLDAGDANSYSGTGTTWYDLSGNGRDATLVNGVGFDSNNGGSLVFNGVDNYAISSDLPAFGNSARTLEVWSKGTVVDNIPLSLTTSPAGTPNAAFAFAFQSSTILSVYGGNGAYDEHNIPVSTNFIDGQWHHQIVIWDANNPGTLLIYGDGIQVGNRVRSAGEQYNTTSGYIVGGWYDFNRFYTGNIAAARVYNRVLSESEVLQNFEATKTRFGL